MKIVVIAVLAIMFSSRASAQVAFEYIGGASFKTAIAATENNSEYVIVGSKGTKEVLFVVLDKDGNLIEKKAVSVLDTLVGVNAIYFLDSIYWLVGSVYSCLDCSFRDISLWVGRFSTNFEMISSSFEPLATECFNLQSRSFLVDSSFVTTGYYESLNGNQELLVKYTPSTNQYFAKYSDDVPSLASDILSRKDSSGYVLYRATKLEYLDSLFNVVDKKNHPNSFSFIQGSILPKSDSTFVVFSEVVDSNSRYFLFGQIDRSYNLMSWDTLYSAPKAGLSGVWNSTAHNDALVESPDGHYYVGGTHHYAPTQVRPFLAKYDQNLNQVWSFKYGTPGRLYYMLGMKETSDNGCMLYGLRNLDGQSREAYILKVNADGVLTGETIIPMSDLVACYPNPAKDFIQFDLPNITQKVSLELIDLSGRVVLAQKINHLEQIDISFLPKAMYGYRVMNRYGELVGMGKLVVE